MERILFGLSLMMILGCQSSNSQSTKQGIKGIVLLQQGNFMPGPGREQPSGQPVERTLYIYDVLKESDLKKDGAFYEMPEKKPVKVIQSDADGKFSVALPVGTYSLLSKEEEGLFANLFDGQGHIFPIEVKPGEYTEVTFKINHGAYF